MTSFIDLTVTSPTMMSITSSVCSFNGGGQPVCKPSCSQEKLSMLATKIIKESSVPPQPFDPVVLLGMCNRFGERFRDELQFQLFLIARIIKTKEISSSHDHSSKIFITIKTVLEKSADFEHAMRDLGLIASFLDNPPFLQDFFDLDERASLFNFYMSTQLAWFLEKSPSDVSTEDIRNLLHKFARATFMSNGDYNKCYLYVIRHVLNIPKMRVLLNEEHLLNMRLLIHKILESDEEYFDKLFYTNTMVHPSLREILPRDTDAMPLAEANRMCLEVLFSDIRQYEGDRDCYVIAPLIFLVRNHPCSVLSFLLKLLKKDRLKFADFDIRVSDVFRFFLYETSLSRIGVINIPQNCLFGQLQFKHQDRRVKLLQLLISLMECYDCNDVSNNSIKSRFIKVIGCHFENLVRDKNINGVERLKARILCFLRKRLFFYVRYEKNDDLKPPDLPLLEDGSLARLRKLSDGSICMLHMDESGRALPVASFEYLTSVVRDILVGLKQLQNIGPIVMVEKLFSEKEPAFTKLLVSMFARAIFPEEGNGTFVMERSLISLPYEGGAYQNVICAFGVFFSAKKFLFESFEDIIRKIIRFISLSPEDRHSCFLMIDHLHAWTIDRTLWEDFKKFGGCSDWVRDYISDRFIRRMRMIAPKEVKDSISKILDISDDELSKEFRSKSTYDEIANFILHMSTGFEQSSRDKLLTSVFDEFYKIRILPGELLDILNFLGLQPHHIRGASLYKELPPGYMKPSEIAMSLRKSLSYRGIYFSKFKIELAICFVCDQKTLPIPFPFGDVNFSDKKGNHVPLVLEMNPVTRKIVLCVRDGGHTKTCDFYVFPVEISIVE